MFCKWCGSRELFPSKSHRLLVRLALMVVLLHKFRCHDCRKSQIRFLPLYWLKLLREKIARN